MADKTKLPLYDDQIRRELEDRLAKIEGQVRGIGRMIDGQRPTQEILQQLASIRSAVKGVTKSFMRNYLEKCAVESAIQRQGRDEDVRSLTKFVKE